MPKISVIIPTYGIPLYLNKAIESVLSQTFQDWELIIVDDNNPDTEARIETEAIVSHYLATDKRIKYIKHASNRNGAVARNSGLNVAKGKYVSFLDSDDLYLPSRLERCLKALSNADKGVGGVYTGCEFRKSGKTYQEYSDVTSGNHILETLAGNFRFCTGSNIFVRRTVFDQIGYFDESFQRHQDYEFLVRFFQHFSLVAIPKVLVVKNNENLNLPNVERLIEIKTQYIDKYSSIISSLSEEERNYVYHTNYINIAEIAMRQNKHHIASQYYNMAKGYGKLTTREMFRRLIFPIYNIIHK